MNRRIAIMAAIVFCAAGVVTLTMRHKGNASAGSAPSVVTADIQAGIEKHITEQTRLGEGHFRLPFGQGQLRLKLVRVHTEYLANLGPGRRCPK